MRTSLALLALAGAAFASPMPQGVTDLVTPTAPAPAGCTASHAAFEITVVNVTTSPSKRDIVERQNSGILTLTLDGGVLKDQAGRTGYIASNFQFQFDGPPQAGAIFTGGFSVCANGSLALGGSAIFYQCLSGNFFNLYDRHWAAQCSPIYIEVIGGSSGGSSGGSAPAPPPPSSVSAQPDGQPIVTSISEQPDGQPIATSISERPDGQPIAAPVTEQSDGQPIAASVAPVTEQGDGQPIATGTAAPVTEQGDGQPIATATAAPVTEQSDGQPIANATVAPVTEQSDGQPIATGTAAPNPVTEQSDGQPIATPAPSTPVAENTPSAPSSAPAQFTGAASSFAAPQELLAMAAGVVGAIALL